MQCDVSCSPESDQLFRATFEQAVIGIAHHSPQGRWLRVNQRLCDLLGYSREELAARSWQDVTHPDDLAAELANVERLRSGELDAYERDKRYVRKDGATVWGHLTVSVVRTPAGEPDYLLAMVQDITARTRLEGERARLLERERAARAEAEATNARLGALEALTDTALSHRALDDLLHELLGRVTAVLGVDHIGILLLDEDGQTLTLQAACGLLVEHVGQVQSPMGQEFAGRIAASRAPLLVDDLATFEGRVPRLREHLYSLAGVPLLVEDEVGDHLVSRLVGVLVVGSAAQRRFTAADMQLLQLVGDRVALAIDRARLYAAEQDARRRAEAALARATAGEMQAAERAERLNTILETMADGVGVSDTAGRLIQTNRAFRELLAAGHLPGFDALSFADRAPLLHLRDAATGEPFPVERHAVARALRGEVVAGTEAQWRLQAFDGREREVDVSAAPLHDGDRRVAGAVSVVRDMTERNRLEREREAARADEVAAREASRRMEAFLAVAAHDLRAPLTAAVGYLDLAEGASERLAAAAREEYPALARQVAAVRDRVVDASAGTERLTRLLTLLFDTAAIRTGKLELHLAPCDLAALVRQQVAALRVAAPRRAIRLRAPAGGAGSVPAAVIPVEADTDRIGQVLTNYLTNALKYAPPDQPLAVSVAARRGWARVAVRDRGPGIPAAERGRVWELFHRAPGIAAQGGATGGAPGQGGSLGLGLYICKAIVEAHGGRVGVASAVGEGSTFWFTLPLAQADVASAG